MSLLAGQVHYLSATTPLKIGRPSRCCPEQTEFWRLCRASWRTAFLNGERRMKNAESVHATTKRFTRSNKAIRISYNQILRVPSERGNQQSAWSAAPPF